MAVKPQPAEADLHSCKTCSLPTADPSTSSSDTCTCDKPAFGEALRWILTVAASMAIFLILWYYERKGVTKSEDKRWFNVLIQGALLMLSLNFVVSHGPANSSP
jgi:hypothetical protein